MTSRHIFDNPADETALRLLCVALTSEMCCGSNQNIIAYHKEIFRRWGLPGYLAHAVLLAHLADSLAPDAARDHTGAIHPSHVLHIPDPPQMRQFMIESGFREENIDQSMHHTHQALEHTTTVLGAVHTGLYTKALETLENAHSEEPEVLEASVSHLLRIAQECSPCPQCGQHPTRHP